jgi:hypothetical protein
LNYLGICAGGFFAGNSPYNGLNLTSGVRFGFYSAENHGIRKAAVAITSTDAPTLDQYWEDGPQFTGWGATVARYPDGTPAVVEGTVGSGWVILSGIHPEAPENWRRGITFTTSVGLDQAYADNANYIPKIGPRIPVLLTSGAEDTTDPPKAADQDYAYYRSHCHCSVAQYVVPNTGHLFMAHKSLPSWIQHVVTWLSAHGVKPQVALPADSRDGRRGPRGLAVKVVPKQLQQFPLHFEVKGSVLLWSGMSPAQWCGGFVDVQVGGTTEKPTTGRASVHRNCTFSENIHVAGKPQAGKARFLRLRFRFAGDAALHGGATKTFLYRLPSA